MNPWFPGLDWGKQTVEKIIILTGPCGPNELLISHIRRLFPECRIKVVPKEGNKRDLSEASAPLKRDDLPDRA